MFKLLWIIFGTDRNYSKEPASSRARNVDLPIDVTPFCGYVLPLTSFLTLLVSDTSWQLMVKGTRQ